MLPLKRILIISFIFIAAKSFSTELYDYNQTIRAFGMGGVHVLDSHDNASMLRNPASLAYQSGINWHLFGVNTGFMADQNNLTTVQNVGTINGLASLTPLYNKNIWFSVSGDTTIQMPYFGFSVYSDNMASLLLTNPAFPNLDMTYFQDWGLVFGGAIPLGPLGALGLNLKRITRKGDILTFGPSFLTTVTQTTLLDSFSNEGIAYGADLGYEIKFSSPFNPIIEIMWKDVGYSTFNPSSGSAGSPPHIDDNLILGLTSHAEFAGFGYAAGIEYKHIRTTYEQLGKKLHFGAELSIPLVDIRAGFYQGYTTMGATIDMWFFQLDLATYSVEKGVYPGQNEDKRAQIGLSMNMGFDANFNLTGAGGRRRNLKQRR